MGQYHVARFSVQEKESTFIDAENQMGLLYLSLFVLGVTLIASFDCFGPILFCSFNYYLVILHIYQTISNTNNNNTNNKTDKMPATAGDGQCEVVLVGCGAPKRGMGWYHAEQLMKDKCPSAKLCFVVEPWFLGGGTFYLALL